MTGGFANGELVVGSFRSLRAFRNGWRGLTSITQSHKFEIGETYQAECKKTTLDAKEVAKAFGINSYVNFSYNITTDNIGEIEAHVTFYENGTHYTVVIPEEQYQLLMRRNVHPAPDKSCFCGFYSFYSYEDMMDKGGGIGFGLSFYGHPTSVFAYGVVENTGRVLHCEHGLRAEKTKVLDVRHRLDEIPEMLKEYPLSEFDDR